MMAFLLLSLGFVVLTLLLLAARQLSCGRRTTHPKGMSKMASVWESSRGELLMTFDLIEPIIASGAFIVLPHRGQMLAKAQAGWKLYALSNETWLNGSEGMSKH